ncbi:MAG: 50S ribosomal protein L37ae [Candidatus ainarchaeum sp.]|nr:50S ribosomal protein L37ae [Candidatus ainarchaeum sp.]
MVKLGVRSGAELRKRSAAARKQKQSRYECPKCGKAAVKRAGNSRWECRSCGGKFAGGAYSLTTPVGQAARRVMENIRKGGSVAAKKSPG